MISELKTKSSERGLTEELLANRFQEVIANDKSGLPRVPHFQAVYREVTCRQGIADFVGVVRTTREENSSRSAHLLPACSLDVASQILGILVIAENPMTTIDLVARTGVSFRTVRSTLGHLVDSSCLNVTPSGSYALPRSTGSPWPDMWAFELKLSNWRRAIFQALQYAAFASHVLVVMPQSKSRVAADNGDAFSRVGVGLLLFDPQTCHVRQVVPARRIGPASPSQALYAAGRIEALAAAKSSLEHR
jgi:hypothetical protein